MEIDIKENRAKTAGKTEVEKMIERAKVDKEPPFFPEIEKAVLKIKDTSARNERKAGDALREPSQLLREAIQYYSNRMIPPGESRPPQEMAIIAVAAETIHRTINKLILDGALGEGIIHFYRAMDTLSLTISTMGAISSDGKVAKAKFGIDPVSVVEKLDKLEGGSDNALELIRRKSARFFDLLEKVGGGRDMSEAAFQREVIKKVGQGDQKALEMLDKLADIEDDWLKHTKLDKLRSTNGAIQILIILLERYNRRMRAEMGNEGFELLELLDAMAVGTCINQKDGGGAAMSDRSRRRPYLETFACRLSEVIEERGISQQKAADLVGVNQSMMWFYCNARAEPRFAALTSIAKEFDVSTDWLLGLTDERR